MPPASPESKGTIVIVWCADPRLRDALTRLHADYAENGFTVVVISILGGALTALENSLDLKKQLEALSGCALPLYVQLFSHTDCRYERVHNVCGCAISDSDFLEEIALLKEHLTEQLAKFLQERLDFDFIRFGIGIVDTNTLVIHPAT